MENEAKTVRVTLKCEQGHEWREGYDTRGEFFAKLTHLCPTCSGRYIGARIQGGSETRVMA